MSWVAVARNIKAPPETVFRAVSDVANLPEVLPHITSLQFLSDCHSGIGTRFRETRFMRGREYKTELEITEFVDQDHVRMVADAGGTIWDSEFAVQPHRIGTRLVMKMDAKPYRWMSRIANVIIQPVVQRGVEDDMDLIKLYCEAKHPDHDKAEGESTEEE